ncbi:MAG: PEP-CTERM sorting domain-containing protein [Gammaproteobacteria bacterium]|nr:MAG: PEP-CTERM sorting domain-containing protein [Gammaproteobacteria bacterium]
MTLFVQFVEMPSNINGWRAVSADGSNITLTLAAEREVRIDIVVAEVPEPTTLVLTGSYLIGFIGFVRKYKK